jgi:hypothetical protein
MGDLTQSFKHLKTQLFPLVKLTIKPHDHP